MDYNITIDGTNYDISLDQLAYGISLSRTGGQGSEGRSAYEVAVLNGFVGTEQEWLDSLSWDSAQAELETKAARDQAVSSATAAATSASNASTSATNAAASASSASTSANNAGSSKAAAATSASNSLTSANNSLASQNAAAISASNAATSATSSANSATTSTNKAAESALSASSSASSASSASSSAISANQSKTEAASSASSSLTSATSATASANTATTKAGEASNSAASALISADNAYDSEVSAQTFAGEANNSKLTAAASSAASHVSAEESLLYSQNSETSKLAAAVSEANAASSASVASTQASQSLSSANNSATSASQALASANNAATSASGASTSAAQAVTSASNALTSANNSATSASQAAASQAAVAANLASFRSVYLGEHATDPTVDGNGDPVMIGAEYFNTTVSKLKVYESTGWEFYDEEVQAIASNSALSASQSAASAASAASSAQTAIDQATIATTKANDADSSEAAALSSKNAAAISESNAAASAAAALVSQSAAATSESNADISEAAALASQNASAVSESNSATSESNALSYKNAAATSASAAAVSETNSATSEANALSSEQSALSSAADALSSKLAAEASESNANNSKVLALASEVAAAASQSAASISESNALSSANDSAASAVQASNSESAAFDSAASALSYRDAAASSAAAATLSESSAATSESNAAASESNVVNLYDLFDDRFLGAKASDPILDNDGNALLEGTMYYRTTTPKRVRVFNGSSWDNTSLTLAEVVTSFNTRQGDITLSESDVVTALGLTPVNSDFVSNAILNSTAQKAIDATGEPMGHVNKLASTISFNNTNRTFSISPASTSFDIWCKGVLRTYSSTQSVVIPNVTGLYYIYFDTAGTLQYKTTYFNFELEAVTAYIYWNATTSKAEFVADERHGVVLDWQTHEYLHRTRGAVIASGFSLANYVIAGDGSLNTHAQLDLGGGTFFDEDLEVNIQHSSTPTVNSWEQDLQGPARIPVFRMTGSGDWVMDTPTDYPLKQGTARPQYNYYNGSAWTSTDIGNNKYGTTWIIATNNINYPVIGILGQDARDTLGKAEAKTWSDLVLSGFPVFEMRPLWKIVYKASDAYVNTPHASIQSVWDLRNLVSTSPSAAVATDHGILSGLSDDDHPQYVHKDIARTITAQHTYTGKQTFATIEHTGLTLTNGALIDQLNSFTETITVTDTWQDTTIAGNDLSTGSYMIQVTTDSEIYTGVLSWFNGTTTPSSVETDEVVLHTSSAVAPTNLFIRVRRAAVSTIQIASEAVRAEASYTFKFRRML